MTGRKNTRSFGKRGRLVDDEFLIRYCSNKRCFLISAYTAISLAQKREISSLTTFLPLSPIVSERIEKTGPDLKNTDS